MSASCKYHTVLADRDLVEVLDLMTRASDYLVLENGTPPQRATAEDFFADCVPGGDPAQSVKLGITLRERLVGISDMGFGYPKAQDAYIGLLLLDPQMRGQGIGADAVAHLEDIARQRGANRLLIAVLEANPKGQAFWQKMGFEVEQRFPPTPDDPLQHSRLRMTREISPA